ncbi:MAG: ABC transporter ATP-binding protein, partial [Acidimicrobiia bacterium]
ASACSNGMRRRADLARLLMTHHSLVLLDEAHAGLDEDAAVIVDEICRRTIASRGAVVMVSHDAAALSERVDRVLYLDGGLLS